MGEERDNMRVLFYIDNSGLESVDLSNPKKGNPGIGGTEYATLLLASLIASEGVDVTISTSCPSRLPSNVNQVVIPKISKVVEFAAKKNFILVTRVKQFDNSELLLAARNWSRLKLIIWMHLQPTWEQMSVLSQEVAVKSVVCLGFHQYLDLIDHKLREKATVIGYPMIPYNIHPIPRKKLYGKAVFVGALVPQKGFHLLADIWAKVKERIPEATLDVIGSGALYNRNLKLGPRQLAEIGYERRIFEKLSPYDGSVNFLGHLAEAEKRRIIRQAAVGIVNPSGNTETFCLSAVEIQSEGVPVVTMQRNGLRDTVRNDNGNYTFNRASQFLPTLTAALLKNQLLSHSNSHLSDAVLTEFAPTRIVHKWIELLRVVENSYPIPKPSGAEVTFIDWLDRFRYINGDLRLRTNYRSPSFRAIPKFYERILSRI
jgi:glycosyltransferase involved in cell wall biosynthesis